MPVLLVPGNCNQVKELDQKKALSLHHSKAQVQPVLTKAAILQKEKAKVTIISKKEKITEVKKRIKPDAVVQATTTATTTTKTTTPTVATITTVAIKTRVLLTKRKKQVCLYL